MTNTENKTPVYTIPPGLSFVDVLAKGILEKAGNDPLALARMHILLPTRRSCRTLREAFLRLSDGKPLLLPRMSPLGDVDEEELSFYESNADDDLSLPPAIAPLKRLFLLTSLIAAQNRGRGIEQDIALANALAQLMDQVYTENLDLKDLPKIVDRAEFADHWQISLDFLTILSEHWPKILAANGEIDAADRRNQLLKNLAAHWRKNPPAHPVIAAGTTGSIPATADLLKVIMDLPQGCIVLPGLDQAMDEESWKAINDTHPQATLKNLLSNLKISREDIGLWDRRLQAGERQSRMRIFTSEIMRPAETSSAWQTISERLSLTPDDLTIQRYDCAGPQEEALTIALALRAALEKPETTAAVVTPDRRLAQRVVMACKRWGIEIDDSAGRPLTQTPAGIFMRLCVKALCSDFRPVSLLDFCKHDLCTPPEQNNWRSDIRSADQFLMRGPAFDGGFKAYYKKIDQRTLERLENPKKPDLELYAPLIRFVEHAYTPLTKLSSQADGAALQDWLIAHLQVCESFAHKDYLWAGDAGEAASLLFSDLLEQSQNFLNPITASDYLAIIEHAMEAVSIRPAYGLHPRLSILGQLEARLVEADVMILAGLNEGTWPPAPSADPWMSRPMRKRFGLPSIERSIGLSAHDFAQNLCAENVILTRSTRVDGTPTVPARWLQRMDTVLQAVGISPETIQQGEFLSIARTMDDPHEYKPVTRPEPRPPVDVRPRKLSVTKIETWMKDPYSIYAEYILKLKPLEPIEQTLDAAMRGTVIHAVLDDFVKAYPVSVPDSAATDFLQIAKAELENLGVDSDIRALWEPRLEKIAHWLIKTEKKWRADWKPECRETDGKMTIDGPAGPFTLSVRADRIDKSHDGKELAVIDYKSGGSYSAKGMSTGQYPQLPLEALILEAGGFEKIKALNVSALAYWVVNGSGDGGKDIILCKPEQMADAKENARMGLEALITRFDDPSMPYYSLPRPEYAPKYNNYEHLARVKEWTALDDKDSAA